MRKVLVIMFILALISGCPRPYSRIDDTSPMDEHRDIGKGRLLYENPLSGEGDARGWVMEGPGAARFDGEWMEMYSPGKKFHNVFWCPEDFPDSFVAEWEVRNLHAKAGLCIVFFAAKGAAGEDIFDPGLPPRDGTFSHYTKGAIDSYHISYYANAPNEPGRTHANLRKNSGFHLVQEGWEGIPAGSREVHKLTLVKAGPHIRMFVDGRIIINWTDDGETFGPAREGGKIGFRQMKWTRFGYRNFRVWELD